MGDKKNNICLWVVRDNARVTKVRLSYLTLGLIASFFILLGGIFALLAGDYARVQVLRLKNFVMLKKAQVERDDAVKKKETLEGEVERLKVLNAKVMAYEQDIRSKISKLGELIESATSVGVIEEDENSATAEPLEGGVGGPEVDCSDLLKPSFCKKDLSFFPSIKIDSNFKSPKSPVGPLASLSMKRFDDKVIEEDDYLPQRLEKYISFLQGLPIATPAHGKLTSGFGYRISPFTKHLSLHEGIDISLTSGANIHSAAAGIVKQVSRHPTYGLMVDVEHSDQFITRYAHLSRALVEEGASVKMGQIVGLSGSTGRSTGPHLHYEVHVNGRAKNPKSFMNLINSLKAVL
jgi:murein DD-endopeptidase MepM/ murein hydrolase activator NlpD